MALSYELFTRADLVICHCKCHRNMVNGMLLLWALMPLVQTASCTEDLSQMDPAHIGTGKVPAGADHGQFCTGSK